MKKLILLIFTLIQFNLTYANIIVDWNDKISSLMVKDGFSPVLASRTFMYLNMSSYLILESKYDKLPPLSKISKVSLSYHTETKFIEEVALNEVMFLVGSKMIYRVLDCKKFYKEKVNTYYAEYDSTLVYNSILFAKKVSEDVLKIAELDKYSLTKSMPSYIVKKEEKFWKLTPPSYSEPLEPNWGALNTLVLDSATEFFKDKSIPYSPKLNSKFGKQVKRVYRIANSINEEQKAIALFWDDNPDLTLYNGHTPFPRRYISPAAHWINITKIAILSTNADLLKTAQAYTYVSMVLEDSKIAVWHWKYSTEVVRPVTFIRKYISNDFMPFLVTPSFPEYPSGHSACSRAASEILTYVFGRNFQFIDNTLDFYQIDARNFRSFIQASNEASISRIYGGIHYFNGVNNGMKLGKYISRKFIKDINSF